jgi:alpha-L-fucosidase
MVRSLQPDAVVFSDVGPDIRWVGNEQGYANEACWATFDPVGGWRSRRPGYHADPGGAERAQRISGCRRMQYLYPPRLVLHERENGA